MQITISPVAGLPDQPETTIAVAGDVITVEGTPYDLASIPEGGTATPEGDHPFVGVITRQAGEIHCTILCLYDPARAEPDQPADPAHWTVTVASGPVALPIIRKEELPA